MSRPKVIRPDARENKTTIQIAKDTQEALKNIGQKGESYDKIIIRLISGYKEPNIKETPSSTYKQISGPIKIGENITITKYERVTINLRDKVNAKEPYLSSPEITLEATYNKPIKKEDNLYQINLKIDRVIFDNELYSPKDFFGVLQKDMAYCPEFVYYYLRSILEVIKIEFKKSNYFFKIYADYFDLARWRTFLLNSKISPEVLSSDIDVVLSDLKNERTNKKLLEDVKNSYYNKIRELGRFN
jgi:hypothetical protein